MKEELKKWGQKYPTIRVVIEEMKNILKISLTEEQEITIYTKTINNETIPNEVFKATFLRADEVHDLGLYSSRSRAFTLGSGEIHARGLSPFGFWKGSSDFDGHTCVAKSGDMLVITRVGLDRDYKKERLQVNR